MKAIRSLTTADAANSTDCCICLFRIASFQSLFVAPCSHVYHFKCIRPLLMANHPGFLCPLCRTFANLEDSVEIDDPIEEDIPAEEVAAAIEKAHRAQELSVEQVREEPVTRPEIPVAEVLAEEVYAPTPPSEQAHTFQPPEAVAHPTGAEATALENAINEGNLNSREVHQDTVMASNSAPAPQLPLSGATSLPMNISAPSTAATSTSPPNLSAQQSPSSAFLMAPSPPPFSSQAGTAPISYGSAQQRSQQSHGSISPSNQIAAAGHMIQNFVRNISIPSRGRTRTNSNSPLNPMVQQQNSGMATVGPSTTATTTTAATATITTTTTTTATVDAPSLQPVGHGDIHGDVFGKTLVVTPPTSAHGSGNSRPNSHNSDGGRAYELGPVLEMESELPSSSSPTYNMNNGSRAEMDGVLVGGDGHSSEQRGQAAAETSA
ncbi:hypothetical protein BGZ79_001359 [Entomortierella chlamydospora]|nr:hypothetical protein BGZ79_001359 [Entomortierella chlamydospora]